MIPSYNLWLVLLSYLVACIATFTTLDLASRSNRPGGGLVRGWMVAGALAMGLGIWAMHFIGMIALHLPVQLSFDLAITLASIAPAVLASAIALGLMRRPQVSLALQCQGALAMGAGIAAMHYTGMAAIRMSPDFSYEPWSVGLSIAVGVAASFVALSVALRSRHLATAATLLPRSIAALVMGFAIVAMHYTGMAGTRFVEGSVCVTPPLGVEPVWLAVIVGAGTCVVLFATLAASMRDVGRLERLRRVDADMLVRASALANAMSADAKASEAHKRAIVESALDAIITIDGEGRIVEFNRAAEQAFGHLRGEVIGRSLAHCIVPPALREAHERSLARMIAGEPSSLLGRRTETVAMRRGGAEFPVELALTSTPIAGRPAFTAHLRDLTGRRTAEQSLRLRSLALDSVDNGICIVDSRRGDGPIEYVNTAFERISGWPAQSLIGQPFGRIFSAADGAARITRALRVSAARGGLPLKRMSYQAPDGRALWCDLVIKMLRDGAGQVTHSVALLSDVTEAVLHEQQLSRLANFDSLTGLPNRPHFRRQLDERLARGHDNPMSLLFVDLDNFKQVNDRLGHAVGDEMLAVLGQRLKACVREGDLVARLGGDEFVMLVESRGMPHAVVEQAVLERVGYHLAQPLVLRGQLLEASCSIGISRFPDEAEDADTLLSKADAAMYASKRAGHGGSTGWAELDDLAMG